MHRYELVTLYSPQVADEDLPGQLERLQGFITSHGGEVTDVNTWGRRRLAYPINRFTEANYVVSQVGLDAQRAAELEANLRISEDVIRYLLVRTDA